MTKQELLTKLATECATWKAASFLGCAEAYSQSQKDPSMGAINITKQDWLAERARLINAPSWADAPEEATHKATGPDGQHWFFNCEPERTERWEMGFSGTEFINRCWPAGCATAFPAGYDWKESLEERPV